MICQPIFCDGEIAAMDISLLVTPEVFYMYSTYLKPVRIQVYKEYVQKIQSIEVRQIETIFDFHQNAMREPKLHENGIII